jgi:hypothetical protein
MDKIIKLTKRHLQFLKITFAATFPKNPFVVTFNSLKSLCSHVQFITIPL